MRCRRASYADSADLFEATQTGAVSVNVTTDTFSEIRAPFNIVADSRKGDPDKVVVVGAHLDSVLVGPGINDNGSGTATILETAIQMSKLGIQPRQKLRFAFWGAEEAGLLGSEYYVANASDEDLSKIYANLNFDMLGSPNYVRFVYDGDGSADPDGLSGPPGSAQIEGIFTDYTVRRNLRRSRPHSTGDPTTDRSSPSASPPADSSVGPRGSRPKRRRRPTVAPPALPTTRATTRPATTSRTSARRHSPNWAMPPRTRS